MSYDPYGAPPAHAPRRRPWYTRNGIWLALVLVVAGATVGVVALVGQGGDDTEPIVATTTTTTLPAVTPPPGYTPEQAAAWVTEIAGRVDSNGAPPTPQWFQASLEVAAGGCDALDTVDALSDSPEMGRSIAITGLTQVWGASAAGGTPDGVTAAILETGAQVLCPQHVSMIDTVVAINYPEG
jgi:hypothetical protein